MNRFKVSASTTDCGRAFQPRSATCRKECLYTSLLQWGRSASRSSCNLTQSAGLTICLYRMQSSVNSRMMEFATTRAGHLYIPGIGRGIVWSLVGPLMLLAQTWMFPLRVLLPGTCSAENRLSRLECEGEPHTTEACTIGACG